jgi:LexA-binding, inner membrane-associated putative hydrolase
MPFTPFHMGPGLAMKALAGRRFSLVVFGVSQVAMDLEVLVRIVRHDPVLHGFTHTYLGATLVAAVSALAGRPLGQLILNRLRPDPEDRFLTWLRGPPRLSWPVAITSALAGTWSHVALDSLMHADMNPWRPFSDGNGLLGAVSIEALHLGCVASAIAGALLMGLLYLAQALLRRG